MRVVITGPTGAIGHAIIEDFLKDENEVLAICHKNSKRINKLPKNKHLRVLELDLEEYTDYIPENDYLNRYDVFFHLAWNGTVGDDRNNIELQKKNVIYSEAAVEMASKFGCKLFIGAGSQAEYGRVEGFLKSDTPLNPETEYGKAKCLANYVTKKRCEEIGLEHIWTRVLSVYGPFDGERSMIISSLRKMISGERAPFTKGEQKWDYLYSSDAGHAFRLIAEKGINGKTYVIGSGNCNILSDYILIMKDEVNNFFILNDIKKRVDIGIGDLSYSDKQVMFLCADISELKKDTGFEPLVAFAEGIKKTIDYIVNY